MHMPRTAHSRSALRLPRSFIAAVLLSLALCPTAAFAQAKGAEKEAAEAAGKSYTVPYMFTIMVVLMIVAPMCWPAMRRWDLPFHEQEE